jgi:hypothetical protein
MLDALRAGLYSFRQVASMRDNVKVEVSGVRLEFKDSTTDADLDHFIHVAVSPTSVGPAQPEQVQEAKEAVVVLPPFQFDPVGRILWSSNGIPSPSLPNRLAKPIEAMLQKDTMNPKRRVWQLDYVHVAELYYRGWIKDKFPNLTDEQIDERFELHKKKVEENPDYYAHRWSTELREFLKQSNIETKTKPKIKEKLIFRCDKRNKCYRLENGWRLKKPLLSKREARTISVGHRDLYQVPFTGKTPIRGPQTDQDYEPDG